jgi:hypothetical protein
VFAIIVNFLRYDELDIPPRVSPATVQRAFLSLGIDDPNIPGGSAFGGSSSRGSFSGSSAEDPVPSYEESIRSAPQRKDFAQESSSSKSPSISDREFRNHAAGPQGIHPALAAKQRIQKLLDYDVLPQLNEQAHSGLYKITLVLVPSNVAPLQGGDSPSAPDIVGLPSEGLVKHVWLKGGDSELEFLCQPAVMKELGCQLKARLPTYNKETGGSTGSLKNSKSAEQKLGLGEARVGVSVSEVCFRATTGMGLYTTQSGNAVIVTIEFDS